MMTEMPFKVYCKYEISCLDCGKSIQVLLTDYPEENEEFYFPLLDFLKEHDGHRISTIEGEYVEGEKEGERVND